MRINTRTQKRRLFIGGEGESERSRIAWHQRLCDQQELNIHLDYESLYGGGYEKMLKEMRRLRQKNERKSAEQSILLVDEDRALGGDDPWSIEILRREAKKDNIIVSVQNPNIEGFFLRLFPGKEHLNPAPQDVDRLLKKVWPDYEKPENAKRIGEKFTLEDLLRLAKFDPDLKIFLSILGSKKTIA